MTRRDFSLQTLTVVFFVLQGLINNIELLLKNSADPMPIVSSLIGKQYNEENFERIADALANVNNVENVKNVLKCENNL